MNTHTCTHSWLPQAGCSEGLRQLGWGESMGSQLPSQGGRETPVGLTQPPLLTHECPQLRGVPWPWTLALLGLHAYVLIAGFMGTPFSVFEAHLGGLNQTQPWPGVLLPPSRALGMGIISLSGGLVNLVSFVPLSLSWGSRHHPYRSARGDYGQSCGGGWSE